LFFACGSSDHCGHYKDRPGAPDYDLRKTRTGHSRGTDWV
jgi:hypothetical protein